MHSGRLIGFIALMVIIMLAAPAAACNPGVSKTGLANACQNTEINYTVKVDYYNEGYVYTSKVVDTLPSGVTYVSSSDGGIYNGLSNPKTVTWYYTVPKTGGSKNFYITVVPTTITTSLTNKAEAWVNITSDMLKGKGSWGYSNGAVSYSSKISSCTAAVTIKGPDSVCTDCQNATYDIGFTYNGITGYDGKVVYELPAGVSYISSSTGGAYNAATRTVTWEYKSMGTSASKALQVTINPQGGTSPLVSNVKAYLKPSTSSLYTTAASATNQWTTQIIRCISAVTITGPDTVCTDCEKAVFDIGYTYTGVSGYYGKVVYELPAGVSYISSTAGGSYDAAARTVSWEFASMSASETKALQVTSNPQGGTSPLVSNVKAYLKPTVSESYSSVASATNQWTTQIIRCIPDVTITGQPTVCKNCAETSYDIGFTYNGVAGYYGKVVYALPAGTSFISSPDGIYDSVSRTVSWEFGPMSASETKGPLQVTINPQGGSDPLVNTVDAYIKPSSTAPYAPGASATTTWTTGFIPCIPGPEYPSATIPAVMAIGFLGIVLYIRKTQ